MYFQLHQEYKRLEDALEVEPTNEELEARKNKIHKILFREAPYFLDECLIN
jgi:hypothetical protein